MRIKRFTDGRTYVELWRREEGDVLSHMITTHLKLPADTPFANIPYSALSQAIKDVKGWYYRRTGLRPTNSVGPFPTEAHARTAAEQDFGMFR